MTTRNVHFRRGEHPTTPGMPEAIERARQVDILNVAERQFGAKLRKVTPTEWVGPCPKCGTDRFSINTSKQIFNCRGCSAAATPSRWCATSSAYPSRMRLSGSMASRSSLRGRPQRRKTRHSYRPFLQAHRQPPQNIPTSANLPAGGPTSPTKAAWNRMSCDSIFQTEARSSDRLPSGAAPKASGGAGGAFPRPAVSMGMIDSPRILGPLC